MKILFLTNILPFKRRNGGEVCSMRMLAHLEEIATEIVVVGRGESAGMTDGYSALKVHSVGAVATEFSKMAPLHKLSSLVGSIVCGRAWTSHRMLEGVLANVREILMAETFDCVVIDHLQIYEWYRSLGLSLPAILVAHNVEPEVYGGLVDRTKGVIAKSILRREQRQLERTDIAALSLGRGVGCLTEADRGYYVELARKTSSHALVEVLPSYFDVARRVVKSANKDEVVESAKKWRIGILGTWTWESNRLGIEWFLREVLPLVDKECEVVIAGSGLNAAELPSRVTYLGFVESAHEFYRGCDVVAIPSIAGGGVQEKTIEAIGLGLPLVVTATAMRGINPCPSFVEVADGPSEFALACSRIRPFDADAAWCEAVSWNESRVGRYKAAVKRLLAAAVEKSRR